MSIFRGIFTDIYSAIFNDIFVEDEEALDPVTLVAGSATADERALVEGSRLNYNLLSLVKEGHADLRRWSQLELDSIAVHFEHNLASYTITDEDFDSHVKSGYTWEDEATSDPSTTDAAIYYNTTNDTFRIKESGSLSGSITRSTFTPRTGAAVGEYIGVFASDAAATADSDYDLSVRQVYFNSQSGTFQQHGPGSSTWFLVADSVVASGTWITPNNANTQAEALTWIEANSPSETTTYQYFDVSDNSLYDVSYTAPAAAWADATISEVTDDSNPIWITGDDLQAYFVANTYDSDNDYFFYDTTDAEVQKVASVTEGSRTWTDMVSGSTYDEVTLAELTAGSVSSSGRLRIELAEDSITADKDDLFRTVVELVEGTETFTCYLPYDLENYVASQLLIFIDSDGRMFTDENGIAFGIMK